MRRQRQRTGSCCSKLPDAGMSWPIIIAIPSSPTGIDVARATQLRAQIKGLREQLTDDISPLTRHRVQTLIEELEAEARSLSDGDAEEC